MEPVTSWNMRDVTALLLAFVQLLLVIGTLIAVVFTKTEVKGVRREVDGRLSQMMDLVGRLSAAPDRRIGPENERRLTEKPKRRRPPAARPGDAV